MLIVLYKPVARFVGRRVPLVGGLLATGTLATVSIIDAIRHQPLVDTICTAGVEGCVLWVLLAAGACFPWGPKGHPTHNFRLRALRDFRRGDGSGA